METTINHFLTILKAALVNEQAVPDREIGPEEWQNLFRMAAIHNVLPMFYEAVYTCPSLQQMGPAFLQTVKRQTMQQVMMQARRTREFLELNRKLQGAGVNALVVKGIICRNLYPKPDYRQSGDEDVLIRAEQFAVCHSVMNGSGLFTTTPEEQLETDFEIPYYKNGSPLYIELHKQLFPPESAAYGDLNDFFDGAFDRAVSEQIQGSIVYTLDHTDHLFYLICHAFKHFLHSGFGIRQVCDIILYANEYGSRIDWEKVLGNCRKIRADKFAAAMFRIGSRYLVFDPEKAAYPKAWSRIAVDEAHMLEDLLSGGVYGDAELSRKHSSGITLDAVAAQKQGRKAKNSVLGSAFPPLVKMEKRYVFLQKCPWLLPVAWLCRFCSYFAETRNSEDNSAADALKIGSERVALLKEYGILK